MCLIRYVNKIFENVPPMLTNQLIIEDKQGCIYVMKGKAGESPMEMSQPPENNHTMKQKPQHTYVEPHNANTHNRIIIYSSNMPGCKAFRVTAKYNAITIETPQDLARSNQTLASLDPHTGRNPQGSSKLLLTIPPRNLLVSQAAATISSVSSSSL